MAAGVKRVGKVVRVNQRRTILSERQKFKNQLGEILSYVEQLEFPFEPVMTSETAHAGAPVTMIGDAGSFRERTETDGAA
jgi:hypothetical protein